MIMDNAPRISSRSGVDVNVPENVYKGDVPMIQR